MKHFDVMTAPVLSILLAAATSLQLSCGGTQAVGSIRVVHAESPRVEESVGPHERASFVDLRVGRNYTCAIDAGGALWCWGSGGPSLDVPDASVSTPTRIPGVHSAFAFIRHHSCVARVNRPPFCWLEEQPWSPQRLLGNHGHSALARSPCPEDAWRVEQCRGRLTCDAPTEGVLRCQRWIRRPYDSEARGPLVPGETLEFSGVADHTTVGVGAEHVCVLDDVSGVVSCAGAGGLGQLGDARFLGREQAIPQWIEGLEGVTSLAAGGDAACAVVQGEVRCWGSNQRGLLGPAGARKQPSPVAVPGLRPARRVSFVGHGFRACAVVDDGSRWCWGGPFSRDAGNMPRRRDVERPSSTRSAACALNQGRVTCRGATHRSGESGESEPWTVMLRDIGAVVELVRDEDQYWAVVPREGAVLFDPRVASLPRVETVPLPGIERLVRGSDFRCGLVSGRVACWGATREGALGFDPRARRASLQAVALQGRPNPPPSAVEVSEAAIRAPSRQRIIDALGPALCRDLPRDSLLDGFDELRSCRTDHTQALVAAPSMGSTPRATWVSFTAYGVRSRGGPAPMDERSLAHGGSVVYLELASDDGVTLLGPLMRTEPGSQHNTQRWPRAPLRVERGTAHGAMLLVAEFETRDDSHEDGCSYSDLQRSLAVCELGTEPRCADLRVGTQSTEDCPNEEEYDEYDDVEAETQEPPEPDSEDAEEGSSDFWAATTTFPGDANLHLVSEEHSLTIPIERLLSECARRCELSHFDGSAE